MRLGTADILVRAKTDKFDKDIDKSEKKVKGFGQKSKKELAGLTSSFASLAGVAGIGAATYALKSFIDLSNEQIAVETRMEAVLKSTGYVAGYSADQIKNMAASLQEVTTVGDEAILAGQAILLTFKKIRGEAFERTTAAALDMSEVMQTDLKSSIVMIGKAMNDPIANLSAMTRAGVQFTDSQKETIKELWKSGDAMGAQKIILKELESQFGGAAKAARNTFGGATKAAGNVLGDFKEEIGHAITKNEFFIESMHDLEKRFKSWIEYVQDHKDEIKQDFVEFAESAKEIGGHLAVIGGHLASLLGNTLRGWNALPTIVQEMGIIGAIVGGVPGRLALIGTVELLGQAVGYIDELVKSAEGISTVFGKEFKLVEDLEGAEKQLAQLEKLRDEFLDLSAVGKKKMGGNVYLERLSEQIDDVEDHIDDLQEKLKATVSEPEKDVEDKKLDEISAKEIPRLTDSEIDKLNERYELEKEINKKIHDETLSHTDRELEELSARYLHYYDYAHDKNALDLWYRTKRDEILEGAPVAPDLTESEQAYMDLYAKTGELTQESYDIRYAQYVKDRDDFIRFTGDKKTAQETFAADINALNEEMIPPEPDLSPMLQAYVDLYDEIGILTQPVYDLLYSQYEADRDAFIATTGDKTTAYKIFVANIKDLNKKLNKSDEDIAQDRIDTAQEMSGMMASTFQTISDIGGKHSKEMFEAYKAFKIAETLIASYSGAMKAYAEGGVYLGPAMAAIILAFGAAQVANIQSQEPPSYDQGGISQAGGIYQTGDIDEAHVPLPSGGKIPVQINNNETVSRHPMSIHIHEAAGTHARTEESDDGMTLDIIIEQVEQKMAGRMNRGAGLASFMDNRYSRTY